MRNAILAAIAAAIACAGWVLSSDQSEAASSAHLDLRSTQVVDEPPFDPADSSARAVAIRIEVAAAPDCTSTSQPLSYGILVDVDRSDRSGETFSFLPGFGADARITADCNGGSLTSPGRTVNVTIDPGTSFATIEIVTSVGALPATEFAWVPYVQNGDRLFVPSDGRRGWWATMERSTG